MPYQIVVNDFEIAKANAVWGTYGKNSDQPLTWKRLVDCETDHLQAILRTQGGLSMTYMEIIHSILKDRGETPEVYDRRAAEEFSTQFNRNWIKVEAPKPQPELRGWQKKLGRADVCACHGMTNCQLAEP